MQKASLRNLWHTGLEVVRFNDVAQTQYADTVPAKVLAELQTRTEAMAAMLEGMRDGFYGEGWNEQPYKTPHNGSTREAWETSQARDFLAIASQMKVFMQTNRIALGKVETGGPAHANARVGRVINDIEAIESAERYGYERNIGFAGLNVFHGQGGFPGNMQPTAEAA